MKLSSSFAYGALLVAGVSATGVKRSTPESVAADISTENLRDILTSFKDIADANGGNRAFGLPGYDASIKYVFDYVYGLWDDYLDTYVQSFNYTFEQTLDIWLDGPNGEDVPIKEVQYNMCTPPDGITGLLVNVPDDAKQGSGCTADQWQKINARNKIALVKRDGCALADVLLLAKAAGARAVLLVNDVPGTEIQPSAVDPAYYGQVIPAGVISLETGTAWRNRLAQGENLAVRLMVDTIVDTRESWNLIVETKEGDPNNIVMLGAHLDSVQAGPGINDNGSGSAALLEIIRAFTQYTGIKNKLRFAWWGAEEVGLVGSIAYGKTLTPEEAKKIRFYFNYDMIGSRYPEYNVNVDEEVHKFGGKYLFEYLQKSGKPVQYQKFKEESSDYAIFLALGIPSAGINSGWEPRNDPCYHKACDTLDNVNWEALTINTKAAAYGAAQLALSLDGLPAAGKKNGTSKGKREMEKKFAQLVKKAGL